MACKAREVGRMTEDIPNRILPTIMRIFSAPHGQDRTSLIEVSPSSRPHVTIPEKLRVALKRHGFLAKTLPLTAVGDDTPPPQVLREKTQSSKCCA
ncbi:hypothetical protein pdam_00022535 [Pocillopora damicornis]|uniref:Uncharacterized protein n=1 Tax=Pocillopora damicornis TaxID=46731 RepID=A0A3M6UMB1_POCDA|nr:hypothetical protein pdam_00022535 [Pocillopora damicornis]